ncbi:hypothetical protein CRYUN_Cryun16bG0076200 [Craigia yunnanensis]
MYVVPIENIFSSNSIDGKERLNKLLDAVSEDTGKEDLLIHLRMLSLQKVASENGYTRVVLGSCTSRIACHISSATMKGQGYSLSEDIQYVDSRWEIPVLLPLRDCPAQELNTICNLDGKKIFLESALLYETAGKLTPFQFNRIPEIRDSNVPLATRRRQKKHNLKPNGSLSSVIK